MIRRNPHLPERRLVDHYMAQRCGEIFDPPVAEHLADCAACAARYAELSRGLDEVRAAGDMQVDAIFTAERLQAQQVQVARKLEHVRHAAQIISFPGRQAGRRIAAHASRVASRWVAAAAVAGVLIGLGLGAFYDSSAKFASTRLGVRHSANLSPAPGSIAPASSFAAEEAFLSEVELAVDQPYTSELAAFDALTPYVQEVAVRSQ
jgi:hypothetical protein